MTRSQFIREDIEFKPLAEFLGWTPKEDPGNGFSFHRGDSHLWFCAKGWACAESTKATYTFVSGNYENHRYYPSLEEALEKEDSSNRKSATIFVTTRTIDEFKEKNPNLEDVVVHDARPINGGFRVLISWKNPKCEDNLDKIANDEVE